jgi:uncharacterized OB-fold protein
VSDEEPTEAQRGEIPPPRPTPLSAPHWDGCREGELRVQRCNDCGTHVFIPQPACTKCFSQALEWVATSGRGKVYSYTIVHRPVQPQFKVPYIIGILEFEEGFHMMTNLIGLEPDDVKIGMEVEVEYVKQSDTITLPYFKPV